MGNASVNIAKVAFNGLYRLFRAFVRRRDEAVFFSRQANEPSYDFREFARQFSDAGWHTTFHCLKVRGHGGTGAQDAGAGNFSYAAHVVKELRLLARCRVVVLDRYDPVVCLLDLGGEFPDEPVVVQAWHAFGALKKFGYQSAGGVEGHTPSTMESYRIHRNYTWVLCSSESARGPFAEAFACPVDRVVPFARPTYFRLRTQGEKRVSRAGGVRVREGDVPTDALVLFAPTLRMNAVSAHPFRELHDQAETLEGMFGAECAWAFHPLEVGLSAQDDAGALLQRASVVVTDYSSIAYDAYLLGTPVVFYVPDHAAYSVSPGLNADPLELCPDLCAQDVQELSAVVRRALADPAAALEPLVPFAAPAFEGTEDAPVNLPNWLGLG